MFKKALVFLAFFMGVSSVYAQHKVEGSYPLKGVEKISIEMVRNEDQSISLNKVKGLNRKLIDLYEVGDGIPEINTIFFHALNKENNIIALVSWDEDNINAIHYKVYAYKYNSEGDVSSNVNVISDKNLEGYEGYSGSGMTFYYKNAASIKKYLDEKVAINLH